MQTKHLFSEGVGFACNKVGRDSKGVQTVWEMLLPLSESVMLPSVVAAAMSRHSSIGCGSMAAVLPVLDSPSSKHTNESSCPSSCASR